MTYFLFLIIQASSNIQVYDSPFKLTSSRFDHKFEITKESGSSDCLLLIKIGSEPYFNYNKSKNKWNISADYFDSVSWLQGSNTLKVSIPGSEYGLAYVALYSDHSIPYYRVDLSSKATSTCLFPCRNSGFCQKGKCVCKKNYGGSDCSVYFFEAGNDKVEFSISSLEWKFYSVSSDSDFTVEVKSKAGNKLKVYMKPLDNSELPTMLDSKEYTTKDSDSFTESVQSNHLRISLYCYSSGGGCEGSLNISQITYESYLWVIIFAVIVGIFFVGAIPLILIYCKKNGKNKVKVIQLNRSQLEKMFPSEHWEGESKEVCSICLEELKGVKRCRVLSCTHAFHDECIDEWAESNLFCPVCKQNLISEYFEKKHEDHSKHVMTEN